MNYREIIQAAGNAGALARSAYNIRQPGEASQKLVEAVLQLSAVVQELAKKVEADTTNQ